MEYTIHSFCTLMAQYDLPLQPEISIPPTQPTQTRLNILSENYFFVANMPCINTSGSKPLQQSDSNRTCPEVTRAKTGGDLAWLFFDQGLFYGYVHLVNMIHPLRHSDISVQKSLHLHEFSG